MCICVYAYIYICINDNNNNRVGPPLFALLCSSVLRYIISMHILHTSRYILLYHIWLLLLLLILLLLLVVVVVVVSLVVVVVIALSLSSSHYHHHDHRYYDDHVSSKLSGASTMSPMGSSIATPGAGGRAAEGAYYSSI